MKLLILCLLATAAYAKVTTTVNVPSEGIDVRGENNVLIPCEFELATTEQGSESQPPIIYWIKGVSVDDENAVVIFKGFKYWNQSHGEYREYFNGYDTRAEVANLTVPSLLLTSLSTADEGRYWCMVAEWSGRTQSGTDSDSTTLLFNNQKFVVSSTPTTVNVVEESSTTITCSSKGTVNSVSWYEGPFHLPDHENFTHTEIGTYKKIGTRNLVTDEVMISTDFSKMNIDSKKSLIIPNAAIADAARYWCEVTNTGNSNPELETARHSTELVVELLNAFVCDGATTGLFADPVDCSMYYECVNGDPTTYHRSCGYDGLVFYQQKQYCDWAANVPPPCGTSTN